jgi:hypothetical protein
MNRIILASAFSILLFAGGCEEEAGFGYLDFTFAYRINNEPLVFRSSEYVNSAGNQYEVTEVQWFISDIRLLKEGGAEFPLLNSTHYVDSNLPATQWWSLNDLIPEGKYSGVRFTFGLKGEKNLPGQFVNPPESNMEWPYALGGNAGGYHYMKLNGFWITPQGIRTPFNVHLGVGQLYNPNHEVDEYVQNWFDAELMCPIIIEGGKRIAFEITMNIQSWFETPFTYDHNTYGGMIMQNQEALQMIRSNGIDVFTIKQLGAAQ